MYGDTRVLDFGFALFVCPDVVCRMSQEPQPAQCFEDLLGEKFNLKNRGILNKGQDCVLVWAILPYKKNNIT